MGSGGGFLFFIWLFGLPSWPVCWCSCTFDLDFGGVCMFCQPDRWSTNVRDARPLVRRSPAVGARESATATRSASKSTGELSVATRRSAFSGALSLKIPIMCTGADGAPAAALKMKLATSACRAPILRAWTGTAHTTRVTPLGATAMWWGAMRGTLLSLIALKDALIEQLL